MAPLALVADDHPGSVELAAYLLETAGFGVIRALTGGRALALAAEHQPDVIVLDLSLPDITGCEVRDRLASDPELAAIPVVAMTVYRISEICPQQTEADYAACIRKPLDPSSFATTVRAVIGHAGPRDGDTSFGS